MKFNAEFHFMPSLFFAPSHSHISPLNIALTYSCTLHVSSFEYAPAISINKHGKQPRREKGTTSTHRDITHLRIHKFSPIVYVYTG